MTRRVKAYIRAQERLVSIESQDRWDMVAYEIHVKEARGMVRELYAGLTGGELGLIRRLAKGKSHASV